MDENKNKNNYITPIQFMVVFILLFIMWLPFHFSGISITELATDIITELVDNLWETK